MRILIVHSRYRQRGGEDAAVESEIAALSAAGIEVADFIAENDALTHKPLIAAGLHALWSVDALRRLQDRIADTKPDILHVHNTFPGLSASVYRAARNAKLPIVQTLHNFRLLCANGLLLRDAQPCMLCVASPIAWQGIRHGCYRESRAASAAVAMQAVIHRKLGASHVARYIALSDSSREIFVAGGLPPARIAVKPNIIPDPGDAGLAETRQGLLFVGRLSQEKGLDALLAALQPLDIPLTIAGSGPAEAALRRKAPANVRWLGAVPPVEISRLMRQAALLVFPSLAFENYPMALAEAMAHGLPVLASNRGAMREMVQHDRTGWLVAPGDAAQWRQTIVDLLARPESLAAAGRAARADYLARFAPSRVIARQVEIYRSAMEAAV